MLYEVLKEKCDVSEEDIEKAYQQAAKSKLKQYRTHVRTEAHDQKQATYRKDRYFFMDLVTADSNKKEPLQFATSTILDRTIRIWKYDENNVAEYPKDPTIIVNDHQIFKITMSDIIVNDCDFQ